MIKVTALNEIVLREIRRITREVKAHRQEFINRSISRAMPQVKKDLSTKSKELDKCKRGLVDLDKLFCKAFEELTLENLSQKQFNVYFNLVGKV